MYYLLLRKWKSKQILKSFSKVVVIRNNNSKKSLENLSDGMLEYINSTYFLIM